MAPSTPPPPDDVPPSPVPSGTVQTGPWQDDPAPASNAPVPPTRHQADHTTLAVVLRAFRKARGYSQERLADLARVDRTYVQKIESGKKRPTFIAVEHLLHALDVGWAEFGAAVERETRRR